MNIMDWEECKGKFIREVEVDHERISSIREKAIQRLDLIKSINPTTQTISFIVEGYYEVIKELLVAYLLYDGLRSQNHQCLISFFYKKNPAWQHETMIIAKMSYYRNRLNYYGENVPETFFAENKQEIENIIKKIILMVKK